jgi:hypothetical protein
MRGHDNDGLLQRLQLLVYPDPPPTDTVVDRYANTSAKNSAFAIFQTLAQMDFTTRGATQPDDGGIPYYRFDPEAQQLFYDWFNDLTRKLRNDDEPIITEHLAKFRSLMPALALIFHLIDVASDPTTAPGVSEMAAKRAAAFCEYLETHARRIYALVTDVHIEAAARLSKRIQGGELGEKFTLRDVYRREWGLLTDRNIVESACDYLVDLGWLRVEEPTYTTGRPRSPAYAVNPRLTSSSSGGAYPPHPEENL